MSFASASSPQRLATRRFSSRKKKAFSSAKVSIPRSSSSVGTSKSFRLISDSLQFGNVPPNLLAVLLQQGNRDIKLIAGSFNGTTYSLIALPKYKKMEDLKG